MDERAILPVKTRLSWQQVTQLAYSTAAQIENDRVKCKASFTPLFIYGVPRGGIPAALLICHYLQRRYNWTCQMTGELSQAHLIIDDIVDSGHTRRIVSAQPGCTGLFYALIDKTDPYDAYKDKGWIVFPWELDEEQGPEENIRRLIEFIGDDVEREGLRDTPQRILRAYGEMFNGYRTKPEDLLTTFTEPKCDEMVLLRHFEFFSTCEHHMLPFFGRASVAYIPDKKLLGVSKLARIVDMFAHRLQIQERIGVQVTTMLQQLLEPKGSACILEAQHLCMMCRGVQKHQGSLVTSSVQGVFREDARARAELFSTLGLG